MLRLCSPLVRNEDDSIRLWIPVLLTSCLCSQQSYPIPGPQNLKNETQKLMDQELNSQSTRHTGDKRTSVSRMNRKLFFFLWQESSLELPNFSVHQFLFKFSNVCKESPFVLKVNFLLEVNIPVPAPDTGHWPDGGRSKWSRATGSFS